MAVSAQDARDQVLALLAGRHDAVQAAQRLVQALGVRRPSPDLSLQWGLQDARQAREKFVAKISQGDSAFWNTVVGTSFVPVSRNAEPGGPFKLTPNKLSLG